MFCSKLGLLSTELNVPTPYPSLIRLIKRCSRVFKAEESLFPVLKDITCVRNLGHLRGVRLMFEKKNSKRARVKKKRKERKKDESVFLLLFSPSQKKNLFHSHNTQTSNIKFLSSFIFCRTKENTHIYIYLFIIIIYK